MLIKCSFLGPTLINRIRKSRAGPMHLHLSEGSQVISRHRKVHELSQACPALPALCRGPTTWLHSGSICRSNHFFPVEGGKIRSLCRKTFLFCLLQTNVFHCGAHIPLRHLAREELTDPFPE